jgi:cytochrome P450
VSFGHGEYACPVGAPEIAEQIARTAIEVLLDRIPDVELAVPADGLRWKETSIMRGLEALPVTFTPMTVR